MCTNFVLYEKVPNIGAMRIFETVPEKITYQNLCSNNKLSTKLEQN